MSRTPRARLVFSLVVGIGGVAILCALGTWQLQRLAWKEGLIAELEARLEMAPVALPEAPEEASDEYLRVAVEGSYAPGEIHVLTSRAPYGPGFRVIAPFETEGGRRILVDRGFIPEAEKTEARDLPGPLEVTGALLWPQEVDGFTPDPDREKNLWFARDLPAMAQALEAEPILVVAEGNPGERPVAWPLSVNIVNDHLEYAITWFSLAVVWAGMSIAFARRRRS
ncbi:SURF1 family protein [Albimonas sp. CAU 1670]|uniref:SURF1 family protein n=1 Tax=Albimonas sp. CAU 1670 TaxID=3032599 RepID=UPI0023DC95FB|nr:SURF1 family protein [Albimonas sp. CAU 1670]MDF2231464.1 SURF1 family protein [Albimonas sp. CAU 1670]